jgi:hypothetical protein
MEHASRRSRPRQVDRSRFEGRSSVSRRSRIRGRPRRIRTERAQSISKGCCPRARINTPGRAVNAARPVEVQGCAYTLAVDDASNCRWPSPSRNKSAHRNPATKLRISILRSGSQAPADSNEAAEPVAGTPRPGGWAHRRGRMESEARRGEPTKRGCTQDRRSEWIGVAARDRGRNGRLRSR